jgi:very-short-patch-repair endonuclease
MKMRDELGRFIKGMPSDFKGRKHSLESNEKNRLAHLGKHYSPSTEFKKGNVPKAPIKIGQHLSFGTQFKKGHISDKKNKTYEEVYGKERGREIIAKFTPKLKAIWNTPEKKAYARERRAKQILPMRDTKIEIKIQDYLNQLEISFNTHRYLDIIHDYQTDIFIPSMNLVIECDGDYWHANPLKFPNPNDWQKKQIEEDKIRTKELKEAGYNVLRLWESDIKKIGIEDFKLKLENNK